MYRLSWIITIIVLFIATNRLQSGLQVVNSPSRVMSRQGGVGLLYMYSSTPSSSCCMYATVYPLTLYTALSISAPNYDGKKYTSDSYSRV